MTPTADERATGATGDGSARPTGVRHGMVLLAMFVAVLLYLDRVCLSTAANVVQRDLGISGPEMDWVLSAFFWTYAFAQLPAGWIGDRFGARWTLSAYVLLWSAMTGLMGIAYGVTALVVLRLGCGLFEAGAYPVAAGIVARWVPYRSRGIASAIVAVGGRLGGAIAPVLTVWLMLVATHGLGQAWSGGGEPGPGSWRLPMIVYGLVGIVVAAIFAWRFRDWPHEHPAVNAAELSLIEGTPMQNGQAPTSRGTAASVPPVLALCRHGSLWLCSFVQFAANLGWAFIVTKMPTYLAEVHGSSVSQQGWLQSLPLAAGVLGLFAGGRFTDFSARRFGPRWGRSLAMAVSRLAVAGAFAAVLFVRDPVAAAVCLAVIGFATDLGMPAVWAFGQDIGGRNVGAVVGWGNMWGNIGAAVSPLFFGFLSRSAGDDVVAGWQAAFLACLALQVLSAAAAFFISSSKPLQLRAVGSATVVLLAAAAAIAPAGPAVADEPARPAGFAAVADLALPAADGTPHTLGEPPDAVCRVLCFLGTECPLARLYGPRLDALARDHAARGVVFIGINSNPQDSLEEIAEYVARHAIGFPVVKNARQQVALALGATRTPEVIVVDRAGTVCYRGRIDDQYEPGIARPAPTTHALAAALDDITAGRPVAVPRTEPVGCLIQLPAPPRPDDDTTGVTFTRDVRPVLDRHCVECHRPGEIGPFALVDYDEAAGWGDMILEVIEQGRMPPWHASPEHGTFSNARHMPAADVDVLKRWVRAGMPRGNAADLPPPPPRGGAWDLPREPDVVVAMADAPFRVPAVGTVEYQYFVVDPGFVEETWVSAVDVAPGNRAVVHHAIVFIRPPDGAEVRSFGLLGAYVPGQRRLVLPPGHAQRVAAGSRLVFQMHYTPTGRPEEDLTRVGLVLADPAEVTHEVFTIGGLEQDFEIPPGAADFRVEGRIRRLPRDGALLAVAPHMHLRGKSFRLVARHATDEGILLDVPRYDFNWQHTYAFAEPLPLAAVDELGFAITFDNSAANPANPDPGAFVTWGDQTWEEMAIMFATVARPRGGATTAGASEDPAAAAARAEAVARRAAAWADDYIRHLDRDGDGRVSRDEAPDAVRLFAFGSLDTDRDGVVTRDEVLRQATLRFTRDR